MGEGLRDLPCAGGTTDECWNSVGVLSPVNMARLSDELRRINNEQMS